MLKDNPGLQGCLPEEWKGRFKQPSSGVAEGFIWNGTKLTGYCS